MNGDSDFRRKKRRKRITKEKDQVPVVKPGHYQIKRIRAVKKVIKKRSVRAEVDEEEVQKQIKETLARLTTKGKSKGSRYRREKREAISQKHREVEDRIELEKNILKVTEFVSVNELAIYDEYPCYGNHLNMHEPWTVCFNKSAPRCRNNGTAGR